MIALTRNVPREPVRIAEKLQNFSLRPSDESVWRLRSVAAGIYEGCIAQRGARGTGAVVSAGQSASGREAVSNVSH
jgi:hypothetical protein